MKLTLGWWDQPRALFFKESPAPLSKDWTPTKANRIAAKWDKRARELRKKKLLRKQQARDRGEETSSDDNDDEFDEAATSVDWGVLEGEDSLSGTQMSTQGPFPFHAGEVSP